jgi:hypothetical protein
MKAWRSVCGPIFLTSPALRATRRTIRPAACRSSRWPEEVVKIGPSQRSPMAQVVRACDARRERDDGFLAVLAGDRQGPVPAFCAQGFDVRAGGLGHPEPVKGEQRDQGVLGRGAEPGRHEEAPRPGGKGP